MTNELRKKIFDKAISLGWSYNPNTGIILNKNGNIELSKANFNNRNKPKTKGYCFEKSTNKWLAQCRTNNLKKYLGRYNTENEAIEAVRKYREAHKSTN